jgi:hypothetical protein
LSGPGTVNNGTSFTATGINFTPNKTVTVNYYDPSTSTTPTTWIGVVACNGSFSHQFTTVASLLLSRTDKVTASDAGSPPRSAFYTFTLKAVIL